MYRRYPTYLLPSAFTLACRLQFLAEQGHLAHLVPRALAQQSGAAGAAEGGGNADSAAAAAAGAEAGQQQVRRRRRGQRHDAAAGSGGAPPLLTLSRVVKRTASSFCQYAALDEAAFRRFQGGFGTHPTWLALQHAGRDEAARLRGLLEQLQAGGGAAAAAAAEARR